MAVACTLLTVALVHHSLKIAPRAVGGSTASANHYRSQSLRHVAHGDSFADVARHGEAGTSTVGTSTASTPRASLAAFEWSRSHAGEPIQDTCPAGFGERLRALVPVKLAPRVADPCLQPLPTLSASSRTATVVIYVHTSFANLKNRLWHSMRSWIRLANARPGVAVVPYMSKASAESMEHFASQHRTSGGGGGDGDGEEGNGDISPQQLTCLWDRAIKDALFVLDAPDEYPPMKLRLASLTMFASTPERFPSAQWVVHVDDDTFVRVDALLAYVTGLDTTQMLVRAFVMTFETNHVSAFCYGPLIIYSMGILPALDAINHTQCEKDYFSLPAKKGYGDDVMVNYCLDQSVGVVCEDGGFKDLTWNWRWWKYQQTALSIEPDVVAGCKLGVHKVLKSCFEVLETGGDFRGCSATHDYTPSAAVHAAHGVTSAVSLPPVAPAVSVRTGSPAERSPSHRRGKHQFGRHCPKGFREGLQQLTPVMLAPRPTDPCKGDLPVLQGSSCTARVVIYVRVEFDSMHQQLWHSMRTWVRLANARPGIAVVPYMSAASMASARAFVDSHSSDTSVESTPRDALSPAQVRCLWNRGVKDAVVVLPGQDDPYWLEIAALQMIASTTTRFPSAQFVVRVDDDSFVQVDALLAQLSTMDPHSLFAFGLSDQIEWTHVASYCDRAGVIYPVALLSYMAHIQADKCHKEYFERPPNRRYAPEILASTCVEGCSAVVCTDQGNRRVVWDWEKWSREEQERRTGVASVPVDACAVFVKGVHRSCFEVIESGGNIRACSHTGAHRPARVSKPASGVARQPASGVARPEPQPPAFHKTFANMVAKQNSAKDKLRLAQKRGQGSRKRGQLGWRS